MFFLIGTIAVQFPEEKKTSDKQQRNATEGIRKMLTQFTYCQNENRHMPFQGSSARVLKRPDKSL